MRLKLIALLLAFGLCAVESSMAQGAAVGRFTMIQSRFVDADGVERPITLKMDLTTGESWELVTGYSPTSELPVKMWIPVASVGHAGERLQTASAVRDWCLKNPNGGTVTMGNGQAVTISKAARDAKLKFALQEMEALNGKK